MSSISPDGGHSSVDGPGTLSVVGSRRQCPGRNDAPRWKWVMASRFKPYRKDYCQSQLFATKIDLLPEVTNVQEFSTGA